MFKRWIRRIRIWFIEKSSKPEPVQVSTPVNTTNEVIENQSDKLVAWVEGHTWKQPGANNYLKESEKVFSHRIGTKVMAKVKAAGYMMVRVQRPEGRYSYQCRHVADRLRELEVTHSLHSHFNAAGETARGCEALVPPTHSKIDDMMADRFTDLLNTKFGFKERGKDGVKTVKSGHNGYTMLDKVSDKGVHAMILEPVFANHRHAESIKIFENEDAYVDIIVNLILSIYKDDLGDMDA